MNLAEKPTIDQLKDIVAHCDDESASHVVWADPRGNVHITPLPQTLAPAGWASVHRDNIRFRLETLQRGCGYLGPQAAEDDEWMSRLFEALTKSWETGVRGYTENI